MTYFVATWSADDPVIRVRRRWRFRLLPGYEHELGRWIRAWSRSRDDAVKMVRWELYKVGLGQ